MKRRLASTVLVLTLVSSSALASTTWYVDGVNGSDNNDCKSPQTACKTIGHAMSLAHSGDSIMVAAATYTENLTISISLKVIGAGAPTTIIDGGGVGTVVTVSANVTVSNVTIQNGGNVVSGGGISNVGTLTINRSTITGNSAGRGHGGFGGGIYNTATATISSSTISGNDASCIGLFCLGMGGGIYNSGTLTINNSTLSGNSARSNGGGITNLGTVTISNSTLNGNSAYATGGGIANFSGGPTVNLQNSIVANSSHGGNCGGAGSGAITSDGYNLSSDGTCNFNNTGDLNNTDPKLGQLGNHGGPTQTIPLLSGSPAIDAGNPSGCTDGKGHLLKTDQRGKPRPDKEDSGGCDMGAFEKQSD